MSENFAFTIDTATPEGIEEAIDAAPHYGAKVASAISRTIEMIHGIEDLHQTTMLEEIAIYVGRASGSGEHVLGRWRAHRESKRHRYGTVLFTCDRDRVMELEGIANDIFRRLKKREKLCVGLANTAGDGRGRPPATRTAVAYLTWRRGVETVYERPGVADVHAIAAEWDDSHPEVTVTRRQVETGLLALKRRSTKAAIGWYPED